LKKSEWQHLTQRAAGLRLREQAPHLRSAGQIVRVKFCRNFGLNHFQLRFTARLSCIGGIEREWG